MVYTEDALDSKFRLLGGDVYEFHNGMVVDFRDVGAFIPLLDPTRIGEKGVVLLVGGTQIKIERLSPSQFDVLRSSFLKAKDVAESELLG